MKLSSFTLARELFDARRALLPTLAIASFSVVTWVALTAAGGAHMFFARLREPQDTLDPRLVVEGADIREAYVLLALLACVLIVPALISLSASAAVAGATGREQRLAILRLLGVSAGAVNRVALWETQSEAAVGITVGTAASVLTAPLWAPVSFQFRPVEAAEMYLPLPYYPAVWAGLFAVTAAAAAWGLVRVSISPLGVARRRMPRAVGAWRLLFFLGAFVAAWAALRRLGSSNTSVLVAWLLVAIFLVALNAAMGFVLQLVAKVLGALPFLPVSVHTATARIATQPLRSWNRVATTAFFCVVIGAVTTLPEGSGATFMDRMLTDMRTGAYITVALTFLLFAVSTVLTQAARVHEQKDLDAALLRMGVNQGFLGRVALVEVLLPLLLAIGSGTAAGHLLFSAAARQGESAGAAPVAAVLLGGVALVVLAVGFAEALRRDVAKRN